MTENQVTEIVRALWSIEHGIKKLTKTKKQLATLQDGESIQLEAVMSRSFYDEKIAMILLQARALVEAFNRLDPVEAEDGMGEDFFVAYKVLEGSILTLETGGTTDLPY